MNFLRLKIFRLILLAIFLIYFISSSLFTHVHEVNGILISHSHFFNPFKQPDPKGETHHHSQKELVLIDILNHALLAYISIFGLFFNIKLILKNINFRNIFQNFYHLFLLETQNLRAPPHKN